MIYTADFETTTDPEDCRVWATGLYCLEDKSFTCFNNISSLIDHFDRHPSSKYFFHNLKFDGEFIFSYLLNNGYKFTTNRVLNPKQFTALISDKGVFYSIVIKTENDSRVQIFDSLKMLPFSVAEIADAFGLEDSKGEIDYDEYRPVGHKLNESEKDYLLKDVRIVGEALRHLFEQGNDKTTTASNAMADFKTRIGKKNFLRWFPILECDSFLREAYKGAFTYVNPKKAGKDIGRGKVLDVNSLYPWVMHEKFLPYGEPIKFDGEYEYDENYPLYIAKVQCRFDLKEGYLPTIQIKKSLQFCPTEYLESTEDEIVEMTMTSIDIELMKEHYDVGEFKMLGGYKFKASNTIFKQYVDYWTEQKIKAGKEKNKPLRTIAKLMLNSLYGKFGLNPKADRKEPYLDDEGIVKYKRIECPERETIYVAVAAFVTAYAREKTISTAQALYDRFIYSDTDSIHLEGLEECEGIWVDPYELGAWKQESTFRKARFLHAKCYVEVLRSVEFRSNVKRIFKSRICNINGNKRKYNEKLNVTVAGLPKRGHENVDWKNFHIGESFDGKMQMVHVKGGIILKPIDFTIKVR